MTRGQKKNRAGGSRRSNTKAAAGVPTFRKLHIWAFRHPLIRLLPFVSPNDLSMSHLIVDYHLSTVHRHPASNRRIDHGQTRTPDALQSRNSPTRPTSFA